MAGFNWHRLESKRAVRCTIVPISESGEAPGIGIVVNRWVLDMNDEFKSTTLMLLCRGNPSAPVRNKTPFTFCFETDEIGLEYVPGWVNLFALPKGLRMPPPVCKPDRLLRLETWLPGLECDLFEAFSKLCLSLSVPELLTLTLSLVCTALGAGCTEIWAASAMWSRRQDNNVSSWM